MLESCSRPVLNRKGKARIQSAGPSKPQAHSLQLCELVWDPTSKVGTPKVELRILNSSLKLRCIDPTGPPVWTCNVSFAKVTGNDVLYHLVSGDMR